MIGKTLKGNSGTEYTLLKRFAGGGMADVYDARRQDGMDVVVKIPKRELIADERSIRKFQSEIELTKKLNHPNIVKVWDQGKIRGIPFMVTERVEGDKVSALVEDGALSEKQALAIIEPAMKALQYSHDRGIFHMDISENNIMVRVDSKGEVTSVKIIDFGLGKMAGQTRVSGGMSALKGATACYEAPEYRELERRKKKEHLCDQYSLGVLAMKLLTASLFKDNYPDEKKYAFAKRKLKNKKPKISPSVQNTILRMLSFEPSHRFPSLTLAKEALHAPPKTPGWMSGAALGLIIGSVGMAFLSGAGRNFLSYGSAVMAFVILIANLLWDMSLGGEADEKKSKQAKTRQTAMFSLMVLFGMVQLGINFGQIQSVDQRSPSIQQPTKSSTAKPDTTRPQEKFDILLARAYRAEGKGEHKKAEIMLQKALKLQPANPEATSLLHKASGRRLFGEAKALEGDGKYKTALSKANEALGHLPGDSKITAIARRLEKLLGSKSARIVLLEPKDGSKITKKRLWVRGKVVGGLVKEVGVLKQKIFVQSDGSFSGWVSLKEEGSISLVVKAKTRAGTSARPAVVAITVDYTAPRLTITSPPSQMHTKAPGLWISGTVDDPNATVSLGGIMAEMDGKKWRVFQKFQREGKQSVVVYAVDGLGNRGRASVSVVVDRTAPKMDLKRPAPNLEWPKSTLEVLGLAEDNLSKFAVEINGRGVSLEAGGLFKRMVSILEGANTITIKARDRAGNERVVLRKVMGNLSCPLPVVESPSQGFETEKAKIEVICRFSKALKMVWIGGIPASAIDSDQKRWKGSADLSFGSNTITLSARDKFGRKSRAKLVVVRLKNIDDTYEPNNSLSQASSISTGRTGGLVLKKGDVDFYKISVSQSSKVTVSIDFTHSKGDLELALLDGNGKELGKSTSSKNRETLSIETSSPVYIKVYGAGGAGNQYEMTVVLKKIPKPPGPTGFTYLRTATYSAGGQTHTVKEYRHNATGLEFVLVPAGSFQMGSSEWRSSKPIHTVTLKAFLISKTEVTQGVWKKIMGNNPSYFKGDDLPVEKVSWNDAKAFCKKTGLRLPTEAQWEYACRAGTTTKYYWSDSFSSAGDYAWDYNNSGSKTHPVAQKKPNAYGLYDMVGNVREWCEDWYHDSYNGASSDGSAYLNKGSYRAVRGGSWVNYVNENFASAYRDYAAPDYQSNVLGFRLVAPFRDH